MRVRESSIRTVVPSSPERMATTSMLDRAWRQARRRAGVIHRPLHTLRHHAISAWSPPA
jgi:hypothetical protein